MKKREQAQEARKKTIISKIKRVQILRSGNRDACSADQKSAQEVHKGYEHEHESMRNTL